jgi:3-oxoadipate enol-lactonase
MAAVVDAVMQRFFTPESITTNPPEVATVRRTLLATNPVGYAGCCAAIRDMDNLAALPKIRTPTLIIYGQRDLSTPWAGAGDVLAAAIPGAKAVGFPTAHLSNLEASDSFSAALLEFLLDRGSDPKNRTE